MMFALLWLGASGVPDASTILNATRVFPSPASGREQIHPSSNVVTLPLRQADQYSTSRVLFPPSPTLGSHPSTDAVALEQRDYAAFPRTSCIVRVPECKSLAYDDRQARVDCFAHEIESMFVDRPVSLLSAATPYLWGAWPFHHGVVALVLNGSSVKVSGGWPEDRWVVAGTYTRNCPATDRPWPLQALYVQLPSYAETLAPRLLHKHPAVQPHPPRVARSFQMRICEGTRA
jgi:hypothetical protein